MSKAVQRRLPREERARQIVAMAAEVFAEKGFGATTRELAVRLGVTQALLYRYFPSKERLIDEVFDSLYVDRWDPQWARTLCDRERPLAERLKSFYGHYLSRGDALSMRLFIRANLDGIGFARRYRFPLTDRVLGPVVGELRHEFGLPDLQHTELLPEERELALVLHGGLVFSGIRKHVYGAPISTGQAELIDMHVRVFLPGARTYMRELHASTGARSRLD
jgi:AcrR family transcriptional regulator